MVSEEAAMIAFLIQQFLLFAWGVSSPYQRGNSSGSFSIPQCLWDPEDIC